MRGPFLTFLLLVLSGLFLLAREGRRFLRDDARYASNPREARLSSLHACLLALGLFAVAGLLLGLTAGLSRYSALDPSTGPPAVTAVLTKQGPGFHLSMRGLGAAPGPRSALLDDGWFAIVANRVVWRGALRWIGYPDSFAPVAILTAPSRDDLTRAERIRRVEIARGGLFESLLRGPVSRLGLCAFEEVRTPWRPIREGSSEYFFTESGTALAPG